MLDPDDPIGGRPLGREALVEPEKRRGDSRVLVAQPLDELHREGGHERGTLKPPEGRRRRRHRSAAESEQVVGQRVGLLARRPPADDRLGLASKILDQHDPQGHRHRPELADGEGLYALVGLHEATERFRIEAAIRVCDERPGDSVDARIAGQGSLGQLGQLAIKAGRQVIADLAQLFVHHVEVIDQPFRRRRDRAFLPDGLGGQAIRLAQHASVVLDARQQRTAPPRPAHDALSGREALGVLFEALDAKELRPDRLLGGLECELQGRVDAEHCADVA